MLHGWRTQPHVTPWWQPTPSVDELRDDCLRDAAEPGATRAFIAHLDGEPVGFIQRYGVMGSGDGWWEDETDPGARGIDPFLADGERLGQGIGRAMIRDFVSRLFDDPAVTVVQTDPSPDNGRAARCYRAAGFHAVGIVRTPDGPALLMTCTRQTLAHAVRR